MIDGISTLARDALIAMIREPLLRCRGRYVSASDFRQPNAPSFPLGSITALMMRELVSVRYVGGKFQATPTAQGRLVAAMLIAKEADQIMDGAA